MTENEMVGWHHRLNEHEFEQTPGVGDYREAWRAAVHGVTKSWTRLSDFTFTFSIVSVSICHEVMGLYAMSLVF